MISLEDLKEALREDTILVSIMYVNNEVGAREPVEEAAELVHRLAIRKPGFIRMPSRLMESIRSVRKKQASICFPSAAIRSMVLREAVFSTSMRK